MKSLSEVIAAGRQRVHCTKNHDTVAIEHNLPPPAFPGSLSDQPEHVAAVSTPRFDWNDHALRDYLFENGYVVVKGIAAPHEIETARDLFWKFLRDKAGMEPEDPATWTNENFTKVGSIPTGIVGGAGFGQSEFMWYMRTLPKVEQLFQLVFRTANSKEVLPQSQSQHMLTSFDGGNIFRPWQRADLLPACTSSGWYHVDQGKHTKGLQCVQGMITLTSVNAYTGGLCVIPKSHMQHDLLVDNTPTAVEDFVRAPPNFPALQGSQILPTCDAGDMILWDSRTLHCSTHSLCATTPVPAAANSIPIPTLTTTVAGTASALGTSATAATLTNATMAQVQVQAQVPLAKPPFDRLLRMAAYVSMTPRSFIPAENLQMVIEKRIQAYQLNMTTNHWPHKATYIIPSNRPVVNDINSASQEKKRLIGCISIG